ncbi:FHA domain-containing protein [Planctomicrobium sp. SH668]|uniref:FHA domain-containing protein n=1 Tax=Planctomicrobium sp. SH668 TaxID=3448126 RepID=UPI003F5AECAC
MPTDSSSHNTSSVPQHQAPSAGFALQIERGISRFPTRPITTTRYLIGAGSNCHLQLGGNIPMMHSVIIDQGECLWIDAVVATPELQVNGKKVRESELNTGDLLEIGEFTFRVIQSNSGDRVAPQSKALDAQEMNAEQLVDHLHDEMEALNEFEGNRRHAAAAMLDAAVRQAEIPLISQDTPDPRAAVLKLLAELHERSTALDRREEDLKAHAKRLAQSHEELHRQLQVIRTHIQADDDRDRDDQRISA